MRLALSWLTVLPVRVDSVDRTAAGRAIAAAPLVGLLLGAATAGLLWTLHALGLPPLLSGLLAVAFLALATRGMHIDGLADTADGLGCYGPPERALRIMKDGGAGPFAVATLIVVMGGQAAAFAALGPDRLAGAVLAVAAGRAAFAVCCLRGVPAARPEGLGALVAGTQSWPVPTAWLAAFLVVSAFVCHPVAGPVGVLVAAGLVVLLVRHTGKRFGGMTGDVLGAACEVTVLVVLAAATVWGLVVDGG